MIALDRLWCCRPWKSPPWSCHARSKCSGLLDSLQTDHSPFSRYTITPREIRPIVGAVYRMSSGTSHCARPSDNAIDALETAGMNTDTVFRPLKSRLYILAWQPSSFSPLYSKPLSRCLVHCRNTLI